MGEFEVEVSDFREGFRKVGARNAPRASLGDARRWCRNRGWKSFEFECRVQEN